MDSPGISDDATGAGDATADATDEEQSCDEAMQQALNLSKAQGSAPGAVEWRRPEDGRRSRPFAQFTFVASPRVGPISRFMTSAKSGRI